MKKIVKIIAVVVSCSLLLSACSSANTTPNTSTNIEHELQATQAEVESESETNLTEEVHLNNKIVEDTISEEEKANNAVEKSIEEENIPDFYGMNDPALIQYIEDTVYAGLVNEFGSEDYVIENCTAIYYSDDYLQEVAYNSKSNIFFGYTLAELDEQFQGERYVFTLGENGQTIVVPFEDYDDTYDKVIKNVAIGTGVILVCITVSVISGGVGAAPISMIFAAAAKTGTIMALSSGGISAVAAGAITGILTHDTDQALKAAALQGSESFKWGAILGAISGGLSEANALRDAAKATQAIDEALADPAISEWRKAELRALKQYGGKEQLSYLAGEEVPFSTPGATRPDVVRVIGNHLEAIEVKYYNLESPASLNTLYSELEREVSARVVNLPANATQRVVLDVTGRSYSPETIAKVVETIQSKLFNIYGSVIPVDIVGF